MIPLILAAILSQSSVQVLPQDTINLYESLVPVIEDEALSNTVNSDGIWYDKSIGIMVQAGPNTNWGGTFGNGRLGVVNGNQRNTLREFFPWSTSPGGTHRSSGVISFQKIVLPKKDGKTLPIVVHRARLEGLDNPNATVVGFDWMFPTGTVLIEFIGTTYQNNSYIQLIRFRIRGKGTWTFESCAPIRTQTEYYEAIIRLRPGFEPGAEKVVRGRLRDGFPGNGNFGTDPSSAFNVRATISLLSPLPSDLVADLLAEPFKPCFGFEWTEGCAAPTTDQAFHIVPNNYDGAFIALNDNTCKMCHQDAGVSARRFGGAFRGWLTGGSEGTLIFHPVETSSLRGTPQQNFEFRRSWIEAGVLAQYDPAVHSSEFYQRIGDSK